MKKITVFAGFDCDNCQDEREYEVMTLRADGEVSYYMQKCECTLRTTSFDHVPVRIMSFMDDVQARANFMITMSNNWPKNMVWHKGRVLSPTLPTPSLAF